MNNDERTICPVCHGTGLVPSNRTKDGHIIPSCEPPELVPCEECKYIPGKSSSAFRPVGDMRDR